MMKDMQMTVSAGVTRDMRVVVAEIVAEQEKKGYRYVDGAVERIAARAVRSHATGERLVDLLEFAIRAEETHYPGDPA